MTSQMNIQSAFFGTRELLILFLFGWLLVVLLYFLGSIFGRRLLGWMFLFTLLAPFLPDWGIAAFAVIIGLIALQGFASLIIGKDAANTMVGSLAADLVRFVVKSIIFPFKLFRNLFRGRR